MPRICEFYGIAIAMYYAEHGAPHFHALYAGHEASLAIDSLEILAGPRIEARSRMGRAPPSRARRRLAARS
jgi:hypothetical protein